MIERIYLKEAARLLGYTDIRSVRTWAFKNHLKLYKDNGAKFPYLLRNDFEQTTEKLFQLQQKRSTPISTDEIESQIKFASQYLSAVTNRSKQMKSKREYIPKLEHEKQVLKSLLLVIRESRIIG